uniref:Uncharacterized protein n=1 Tax=Megaselia scalaris TaxID=36166 RepID=T1H4J2_MEGSC
MDFKTKLRDFKEKLKTRNEVKIPSMGFSDIHIQNLDNSSQQRSTNAKLPPENSDKDLNSVQKPDQEILESIEPIYFSEGED